MILDITIYITENNISSGAPTFIPHHKVQGIAANFFGIIVYILNAIDNSFQSIDLWHFLAKSCRHMLNLPDILKDICRMVIFLRCALVYYYESFYSFSVALGIFVLLTRIVWNNNDEYQGIGYLNAAHWSDNYTALLSNVPVGCLYIWCHHVWISKKMFTL